MSDDKDVTVTSLKAYSGLPSRKDHDYFNPENINDEQKFNFDAAAIKLMINDTISMTLEANNVPRTSYTLRLVVAATSLASADAAEACGMNAEVWRTVNELSLKLAKRREKEESDERARRDSADAAPVGSAETNSGRAKA